MSIIVFILMVLAIVALSFIAALCAVVFTVIYALCNFRVRYARRSAGA